MVKQAWTEELVDYIKGLRQERPVPARSTLTAEEERYCQTIGGEFLHYGDNDVPHILRNRTFFRALKFDPEPVFVITTSMPGLVAMDEIAPRSRVVWLLDDEFASWERQHPDDGYKFYIHHWSLFEPPEPELLLTAREAFAHIPPADFRLHRAGDMWGPSCGMQVQHLWHWDGQELHLLQEQFERCQY